ncbi:MAG: S9 family peptidase [Lewinellaceae bacterium]|nr:S9 family peptidase [Saprospiraceae bacterium]MCB9311725.1 S9 family peptidase [Lewinellaceae bacterium]
MLLRILSSLAGVILFLTACQETSMTTSYPAIPVSYPPTRTEAIVDTYFSTPVADPYRWLEIDTAAEVEAWVKAQNEVTFGYLDQIPFRTALRKRYEELFNFPKVGAPNKAGDYYFFSKNDGLQNQAVIYIQKGLEGKPEVFLDPNTMSADGTAAVEMIGFSPDNRYVAYSRSDAGSDWSQIRIIEIETRRELDDRLDWVKFSGAGWTDSGFFYSRMPEPQPGMELSQANQYHSVYFHKLGDPQSADKLIYRNEMAPQMYHWTTVTEDLAYLVLYASTGTDGFETYVKDLRKSGSAFQPLFTGFSHKNVVVDHVDGHFLVHTDIQAPNYRLIAIDPARPDSSNWTDVIPEKEDLLTGVTTGGGKLFANYLKNATTRVYRYDPDGTNEQEIQLPGLGSADGFSGKQDDQVLFYSYMSFTDPGTIFRYDVASGTSDIFFRTELKFNPEDYEEKQVFYKSADGTMVSMFLVHKKDLIKDGNNPCYLYSYGGFNVSLTPSFSTSRILLLENGGVFAMPNLRGGGEYGEEWHKAGMLDKKQNVFDDMIAAAEYLIAEGYTSSSKLAIAGGSNGGLLVGACVNQRPDLFKVAFPAVGVMDMLRYHKFTVGWGWVPEYGSSEDEKMFPVLLAYSPYHNLKKGTSYPATLVTTADHDDRVVPAHSFKYAAMLQACQAGDNPTLIRIETSAGHGAGKPTSKIIDEQADIWSFFFYNTQTPVIYPTEK